MINFDNITKENIRKHSPNWSRVPDHPCKILIVGGSGSGKTNALSNLISREFDIDKIYLHTKYSNEAEY